MISALIFDFDGLILDTESYEYRVTAKMFEKYGGHLPIDIWVQCVGTDSKAYDPLQDLEKQTGYKIDREQWDSERKRQIMELLEKEEPLPGVKDYLQTAKNRRLKIGLASSSHFDWVSGHLKRLGLYSLFSCIRTADDVEQVKPHPELYVKAAKGLGVSPEQCLAFEDSLHGVRAAKRAGMRCVAVPNMVTAGLDFREADLCLSSLAEIGLEQLLNRLGEKTFPANSG